MTCFPSFVWFGRPRARRCGNVSANRTKGWVGTRVRIRTLEKNVSATSTSPKLTGEKTWGRWRRKRKDVSRLAREGAAGERARASLKSPIRGERRKIQKPGTVDETATYLSGLVGGRGHPGGDPLRVEGERLFPARRRRVGAGDASRRLRRRCVGDALVESRGSAEQVESRELVEGHLGGDTAVGRGKAEEIAVEATGKRVQRTRVEGMKPGERSFGHRRVCTRRACLSSGSRVTTFGADRELSVGGSFTRRYGDTRSCARVLGSAHDAGFLLFTSVVAEVQ